MFLAHSFISRIFLYLFLCKFFSAFTAYFLYSLLSYRFVCPIHRTLTSFYLGVSINKRI